MSSARGVIINILCDCGASTARAAGDANAILRALDAAGYTPPLPKEDVMNAVAHLAAATSAYEKYAGNSEHRSIRDPFFKTRLKDFQKATFRARKMVRTMTAVVKS